MLEMPYRQFALPLFGDLFDAPKTFPVTNRWQDWMRQGFVVVYVNSDQGANNFATYGGIAALAAGREAYFQTFYPLDGSANLSRAGLTRFLGGEKPFSESLVRTVQELGARGVVWWVERPTRFDQWLTGELAGRGGTSERWPPASSDGAWGTPSTFVVLEGPAMAAGMAALDALDIGRDAKHDLCLELSPRGARPLPTHFVNAVAAARGADAAEDWVVVADDGVFVGGQMVRTPARAIAAAPSEGTKVAVMDAGGAETVLSVGSHDASFTTKPLVRFQRRQFIGANCAARVGDGWWLVDPLEGRLSSNLPTDWIPARPWIGVAGDGAERLILASADQQVAILKPATREVERVFPAHVWESFKQGDFGACPVIRLLDGYVASFELNASLLALYTMAGEEVSTLRLADALGWMPQLGVTAIDVSDGLLVLTEVLGGAARAQLYSHAVTRKGPGCRVRLTPPRTEAAGARGPGLEVEISGVRPFFVEQTFGAPQQDRSVVGAELRAADGTPIKGIGVHAMSEMLFSLEGRFRRFHASVGTTVAPGEDMASVAFEVIGDGRPLWRSEVLRSGSQRRVCEVDVRGVDTLELRVTDGGDGITSDHAAWFEPVLE